MAIKHLRCDNLPKSEVTMQLLRLTCPFCKKPVQYAIQDDDRLFRRDAEYYEKRCSDMSKEITRLNEIIAKILILKAQRRNDGY